MVFSHLCWQCSDKTRKCQEHKNTLRKKEKLIFLVPILEIKTKNLLSAGKGTRVLVPGHQNSGAPHFLGDFLEMWGHHGWLPWDLGNSYGPWSAPSAASALPHIIGACEAVVRNDCPLDVVVVEGRQIPKKSMAKLVL